MNMNPTFDGLDEDDDVPITVLLSHEENALLEDTIARLRLRHPDTPDDALVDAIFRQGLRLITTSIELGKT
jgi:hypothetical protein